MADRRREDWHRTWFKQMLPGALIVTAVAVVGGGIAVFVAKPDLLEGIVPVARTAAESQGESVERSLGSAIRIGRSVQGRGIDARRVGCGSRIIVVAGAIHGDEANTAALVESMATRLADAAELLPDDVSVFLVARLNPDGLVARSRGNARGVDLNRNWATSNWQSDTVGPSGGSPGEGRVFPFSEPETAGFAAWLLGLRDRNASRLAVIMYHSAYPPTGLIQPGYRLIDGQPHGNRHVKGTHIGVGFGPT